MHFWLIGLIAHLEDGASVGGGLRYRDMAQISEVILRIIFSNVSECLVNTGGVASAGRHLVFYEFH